MKRAVLLILVVIFSFLIITAFYTTPNKSQADYLQNQLRSREKIVTERTSEIFLRELEMPS